MLVEEIFGIVGRLVKQERLSVLLVEQNAAMALAVADHGYVMENGRIVLEGPADKPARQFRHQGVLSRPQRGRDAQILPRHQALQEAQALAILAVCSGYRFASPCGPLVGMRLSLLWL